MIAIFVVFYFLLIRPQQKRAKEHKAMLEALQKGDEVVTAGGIVGKVGKLTDQYVTLEVAPGVEMSVQRPRCAAPAQGHDQGALSRHARAARRGRSPGRAPCRQRQRPLRRRPRRSKPSKPPMNRYPLWKYLVIAVALLVGFVYTLPNFFGEVPAVQVSSSKATVKIDDALLAQVEEALKAAKIAVSRRRARRHRRQGPLRRHRHADQGQGCAAGEARRQLHRRAEPAVGSPHWLTAIGALPMYLGLDLRGGVHFLLQVDMKAALDKAADRYTSDIRSLLRDKKIQYAGIGREGNERRRALPRRGRAHAARASRSRRTFADLLLREAEARAASFGSSPR